MKSNVWGKVIGFAKKEAVLLIAAMLFFWT